MKSFTWERRILYNSTSWGLTGWGATLLKNWYSKLHRSHQCTLAGRKANSILCCMNRSTVRRLREEIIPLYSALITRLLCRVLGSPEDIDKLK